MGPAAAFIAMAGAQTGASIYQAQGIKAQGRMEEEQNNFNAKMSELQAKDALERGKKDVSRVRRGARQVAGSQRAGLAAQGILVDSGSAADILSDTKRLSEEDIATTKNNAWRESFGYRTQAANYRIAGKMARWGANNQAMNTMISGGLGAGQSIMSSKR